MSGDMFSPNEPTECPVCGDLVGCMQVQTADDTGPESQMESILPIGYMYIHWDNSTPKKVVRACKEQYVDLVRRERPLRTSSDNPFPPIDWPLGRVVK
jgi:hypothetical protein